MITFRHAGDLGDIVLCLPALKHIATIRNDRAVLLIEAAQYTRQVLTPDKWFGLDQLIKAQPYIEDVRAWRGESVQFNCNDFRARMQRTTLRGENHNKSLVDWQLEALRCPLEAKDEPWLHIEGVRMARVIINRTGAGRDHRHVYTNPAFPWRRVMEKYGKDAAFIGTELEHQEFCAAIGEIPHCVTPTLYEAAAVIAGADLFIGNQSVCHAIAEGLKQNIILEVWRHGPNCLSYRSGVVHGWTHETPLPNLPTS